MSDTAYSERFERAVALAVADFRTIFRKGGRVPYLMHLFSVTALVGEAGGSEDQLIAAMLHDWLEDVPGASADRLEHEFGPEVRRLVEALSDSTTHPKSPWRERKERYLSHLVHQDAGVKLVSCADKLHNASGLLRDLRADGLETFERFTGKKLGTLWYYASIVTAMGEGFAHPLLDKLSAVVSELHDEAGIAQGTASPS